eukprot:TRINITY_DN9435_c0_g2_i3.p1 TRINITY_DN9435_c0_g2~~TRINITY_DN9435_c0_g2_i3.p1  ORF type:complete len:538 (-),score=72.96 TRINITY_DN9435_c0_g2_i3:279-1892(-)
MRWASLPADFNVPLSFPYPHSVSLPSASAVPSPSLPPLSPYVWDLFRAQESIHVQKIVLYYKTAACSNPDCNQLSTCFHHHSGVDRRRPPFVDSSLAYFSQLCPNAAGCLSGDRCVFAHSRLEIDYHPANYKAEYCKSQCNNTLCPYAHSSKELRLPVNLFIYQPPITNTPIYTFNSSINLNTFKAFPCASKEAHSQKRCVYYHSGSDRRRVPVFYSAEKCVSYKERGYCEQGDACSKSHNIIEQFYHPDKYKKRMCHELALKNDCEYGSYCGFAHAQPELKIELLHEMDRDYGFYMWKFKTEWCPFTHEHNKSICVYAHNWQDYRRSPLLYSSRPCPNWSYKRYVTNYENACVDGFLCKWSHGWKESQFHPSLYKTALCPEPEKCHKGLDCPYYHSAADMRHTSTAESSSAKDEVKESLKGEVRRERCGDESKCVVKKYKQCKALMNLHLEEEDDAEALNNVKLKRLLGEIGLEKYYERFIREKVTIYDLMISAEEKCRLAGVESEEDIRKIALKVKSQIEDLDDSDSPGIFASTG